MIGKKNFVGGIGMNDLKIIVPENFREFGEKVNEHINTIRGTDSNYLVDIDLIRFNNGEGKAVINESIRDKDLYIMSDVTNYDISYKFFGRNHYMSPDEHFTDIIRILSAECGHASKRTLILPYLYESRQDKKDGRESLDCGYALEELVNMGANEIITCDVHNRGVMNAVHRTSFESVLLSDMLLLDLLKNEEEVDLDKYVIISPDEGAQRRARLFSELLGGNEFGHFYKQRDYTKVVDGKNPIVAHKYSGSSDLKGRHAIIVDDMIASGGSILDSALTLKKLGVEKIYLVVTFALFTEGAEKFNDYYRNGIIDRVYATNASYIPKEYKCLKWFKSVDCSYKIANIINELNYGRSISDLITGSKTDTAVKIKKLRKDHE